MTLSIKIFLSIGPKSSRLHLEWALSLVWVMSYHLEPTGANFQDLQVEVTGPLLTYEVLSAFFLEAGF